MKVKYPYRVFISFSHGDEEIVRQIREHIGTLGARPMSDHNLDPGVNFTEEIKRYISFAHIFMPVLTVSGSRRPWVHQEIGYAMGLGIPILPVAVGALPDGLAQQIQAISLLADVSNLSLKITSDILDNVIERAAELSVPNYHFTERLNERSTKIAHLSRDVIQLKDFGKVRMRAPFSSFSIPVAHPNNPRWEIYDGIQKFSTETRKLLSTEREVLERHARERGCDLILDPLPHCFADDSMRRIRIEILMDFLESMDDDSVRVVFCTGNVHSNFISVGDYFFAEAAVSKHWANVNLTTFTKHGPTVLQRIKDFDSEIGDLLEQSNLLNRPSRTVAIDRLFKDISA